MALTDCIQFDCSAPAVAGSVYCAAHAQRQPQPGVVEPALEEKARRAGEAAMRAVDAEIDAATAARDAHALAAAFGKLGLSKGDALKRAEFELREYEIQGSVGATALRPGSGAAVNVDTTTSRDGGSRQPTEHVVNSAPVLDYGEMHASTSTIRTERMEPAASPGAYLTACLQGEQGEMRRGLAKLMTEAMESALRRL